MAIPFRLMQVMPAGQVCCIRGDFKQVIKICGAMIAESRCVVGLFLHPLKYDVGLGCGFVRIRLYGILSYGQVVCFAELEGLFFNYDISV